jgi:hypothetical protein
MIVLCPGGESRARVQLSAHGVAHGCEARYTWRPTGGRIIGEGPNVVWDFSGTPPGELFYDVLLTVEARPGCGPRHAESPPARVTVGPCPPLIEPIPPPVSTCPSITLDCPAHTGPGEWASFTARLDGGTRGAVPTFNWKLSDGVAVGRRDARSILVDPKKYGGQTILATVNVGGYGLRCSETCRTEVARVDDTRRDDSSKPLTLRVLVRNARDLKAVRGAHVAFYRDDNSPAAEDDSGDDGSLTAESTPGTYRVKVSADGFETQVSTRTFDESFNGPVVLSLNPAPRPPAPQVLLPVDATTPTPTPTDVPKPPDDVPTPFEPKTRPLTVLWSPFRWLPWALGALLALAVAGYALRRDVGIPPVGVDEDPPPEAPDDAAEAAASKEADDVSCTVFAREQVSPSDVFQVQVFVHTRGRPGRGVGRAGRQDRKRGGERPRLEGS